MAVDAEEDRAEWLTPHQRDLQPEGVRKRERKERVNGKVYGLPESASVRLAPTRSAL